MGAGLCKVKSTTMFPIGSQENRRIFLFLLSYQVHSQIWLNYFVNDDHFGYVTKSLKKTLGTTSKACAT